jgi:hypothetical protein
VEEVVALGMLEMVVVLVIQEMRVAVAVVPVVVLEVQGML